MPWQDYMHAPDVILVQPDPNTTRIDLTLPTMQVARGSVITDADGTRQGTLLIPPGVTAIMVFPDGSTAPLTDMTVRITECG